MLEIAHPKRGDTLQLPLMADFATDPIPPKQLKEDVGQASLFGPPNDEATTEAASHVLISVNSTVLGGHPEPNKDAEADGQYPIMLQKAEG